MESNHIDKVVSQRPQELPQPTHTPDMKGRIMVAVEQRRRREGLVRGVKIAVVAILIALALVALALLGLMAANELFGLEFVMFQVERYMEVLLGTFLFLLQRKTLSLILSVCVVLGIIAFISQMIGTEAAMPRSRGGE